MTTTAQPAVEREIPLRFVQHLVSEILTGDDCEVATQGGEGRCIEEAVAIRWEDGFADQVCQVHAERAVDRGAAVVFAERRSETG